MRRVFPYEDQRRHEAAKKTFHLRGELGDYEFALTLWALEEAAPWSHKRALLRWWMLEWKKRHSHWPWYRHLLALVTGEAENTFNHLYTRFVVYIRPARKRRAIETWIRLHWSIPEYCACLRAVEPALISYGEFYYPIEGHVVAEMTYAEEYSQKIRTSS